MDVNMITNCPYNLLDLVLRNIDCMVNTDCFTIQNHHMNKGNNKITEQKAYQGTFILKLPMRSN
jgi:hypothetical protein